MKEQTGGKPLATLVLMTYRQENFVREALQGAFAQTYQPLEIIISDDASPDNTWTVVQEVAATYSGPHKLTIRRNETNLGINRHFNVLMPLVNGEFVVIAAGDDISLPNRVATSVQLMLKGAAGVHGNAIVVDENSKAKRMLRAADEKMPAHWDEMLRSDLSGVVGATLAWRRAVNEVFGPIPDAPLGEDAFIPFRCALLGEVAYTSEPLIRYRSHDGNVSFWKALERGRRRDVGRARYRHQIRELHCWKQDAEAAYLAGYLDDAAYSQVQVSIAELIKLFSVLECSLQMSLPSFVLFAWRKSKGYSTIQNTFVSLLKGHFLYAHLNLYRLLNMRKLLLRLLINVNGLLKK